MDHSGLDGELINSPLACWDSRQGELSASSVSGRATRGELLRTNCTSGNSYPRAAGLEVVYVALLASCTAGSVRLSTVSVLLPSHKTNCQLGSDDKYIVVN